MTELKSSKWKPSAFCFVAGIVLGYLLHNIRGSHQPLPASKLLDWPVITLVLVASLVTLFFDSLTAAISRGELTIGWGKDRTISIRNLSNELSGELDPIKDNIATLKEALGKLQAENQGRLPFGEIHAAASNATLQSSEPSVPKESLLELKRQRLRDALTDPKYKWRSIDRLAVIVASSESDVINLLLTMDDVRLSRGITGNQIAGLRSRVELT